MQTTFSPAVIVASVIIVECERLEGQVWAWSIPLALQCLFFFVLQIVHFFFGEVGELNFRCLLGTVWLGWSQKSSASWSFSPLLRPMERP